MTRFWLTAALVAAGGVVSGTVVAEPCASASIEGTWRLQDIQSGDPGVEAFYASIGDEWMRFGPDGDFAYLAARNGGGDPAAIQTRLDAADAADGVTYRASVAQPGLLAIARDGRIWQAFQCRIADQAEADVEVGDMILTNLAGAPEVRRVQRRIAP